MGLMQNAAKKTKRRRKENQKIGSRLAKHRFLRQSSAIKSTVNTSASLLVEARPARHPSVLSLKARLKLNERRGGGTGRPNTPERHHKTKNAGRTSQYAPLYLIKTVCDGMQYTELPKYMYCCIAVNALIDRSHPVKSARYIR